MTLLSLMGRAILHSASSTRNPYPPSPLHTHIDTICPFYYIFPTLRTYHILSTVLSSSPA